MKKIIFLTFVLSFSFKIFSQPPAGYYKQAKNKTGYELKTALHKIIKSHTVVSYNGLKSAYRYTDVDKYYEKDGSILDMYSENPYGSDPYNYNFNKNIQNFAGEGHSWNREHSFPKSWFNKGKPMYSDIFHVYPTDAYVNNRRSNYPYGETNGEKWKSENGSKVGKCTFPGYSGIVFEPIDEFKGDLARTYFYMATCYQDKTTSWHSPMLKGNSTQCFSNWALDLLIKWHEQDPVSQRERDRNNTVYTKYQHNRNPYIDHPEWVKCAFKNNCNTNNINIFDNGITIFPNPCSNGNITVSSDNSIITKIEITNSKGQLIFKQKFNCYEKNINLSYCKPGVYFIKIYENNNIANKKIIIK